MLEDTNSLDGAQMQSQANSALTQRNTVMILKKKKKTLSRLSAHMVNRLLCENRKSISIFLNGKNF